MDKIESKEVSDKDNKRFNRDIWNKIKHLSTLGNFKEKK